LARGPPDLFFRSPDRGPGHLQSSLEERRQGMGTWHARAWACFGKPRDTKPLVSVLELTGQWRCRRKAILTRGLPAMSQERVGNRAAALRVAQGRFPWQKKRGQGNLASCLKLDFQRQFQKNQINSIR
jgi:hypothetical protein